MKPHPTQTIHFFLDANVLVSAAWREKTEVAQIWEIAGIALSTSDYVLAEVRRNLPHSHQKERLERLLRSVHLFEDQPAEHSSLEPFLPLLPEKDRPVLTHAVAVAAHYLITGDKRHFGQFFGQTIRRTTILSPTQILELFPRKQL